MSRSHGREGSYRRDFVDNSYGGSYDTPSRQPLTSNFDYAQSSPPPSYADGSPTRRSPRRNSSSTRRYQPVPYDSNNGVHGSYASEEAPPPPPHADRTYLRGGAAYDDEIMSKYATSMDRGSFTGANSIFLVKALPCLVRRASAAT